jgi:hypothetical protein
MLCLVISEEKATILVGRAVGTLVTRDSGALGANLEEFHAGIT